MAEVVSEATGEVVRQPRQVIDYPGGQAVIEQIRELRASGNGYRAIARSLDDAGIDCRGRGWCHTTVKAILARIGKTAEVE